MSDIAIKAEHLSKKYRLGVINNGTLFADFQTWVALKRGKEDPHSKIGEDKYSGGKDHFWALKDLNFEIKQGDRVGIIGKNGAGKSTLLKILSRITTPTEGLVKIKGKITSLLEVGTGFHGELTGRENIYLNGAILGMKKKQIDRKMDEIIDFSGIERHIDTPVKRYSSGMYVRLAFAVAAHLDSDILIADEVLAVGDAEFQKKALGKMQDVSTGEGRTVLFVSHNMVAVRSLCNSGIVLEKGRIRVTSNNIKSLINEYINNFDKKNGSLKWRNDGTLYSKHFNPISMELQEENGDSIKAEIFADKNYRIKLVFQIEEVDCNVDFYFVFADEEGEILFYTSPTSLNFKLHIGESILYCYIPGNILGEREYIISLGSTLKNTSWIIDPYVHAVSIRMKVIKRKLGFASPQTIISPLVQWISE